MMVQQQKDWMMIRRQLYRMVSNQRWQSILRKMLNMVVLHILLFHPIMSSLVLKFSRSSYTCNDSKISGQVLVLHNRIHTSYIPCQWHMDLEIVFFVMSPQQYSMLRRKWVWQLVHVWILRCLLHHETIICCRKRNSQLLKGNCFRIILKYPKNHLRLENTLHLLRVLLIFRTFNEPPFLQYID